MRLFTIAGPRDDAVQAHDLSGECCNQIEDVIEFHSVAGGRTCSIMGRFVFLALQVLSFAH